MPPASLGALASESEEPLNPDVKNDSLGALYVTMGKVGEKPAIHGRDTVSPILWMEGNGS
jgi:hypothetical protein